MALEVAPDYQQEFFDEGLGKAISWLASHPKGSTLDAATAAVQAIGTKCAGKGIGGERWGEFLTARSIQCCRAPTEGAGEAGMNAERLNTRSEDEHK